MSTAHNGAAVDVGAMLTEQDMALIRTVGTNVWDLVDDFSVDFTHEVHKRVPELGKPGDEVAFETNRKSSVGSMYEFLAIMRAGIFAPNALETSPEALERCATDNATLEKMRAITRNFIFMYVDQITKRLAAEYGVTEREGFNADPNAPVWHDPDVVAAAQAFLAGHRGRGGPAVAARAHSEQALERFCVAMEAAADNPTLSRNLARADTTVRIELADDPDLAITLLLDRTPIEVVDPIDAAVELSIASVDLDRLRSPDFHLAMAIARGRVTYSGDVRKFLRITPIVRHASLPSRPPAPDQSLTAST
jgi:hypothetical protein